MKRRDFLKTTGAGLTALTLPSLAPAESSDRAGLLASASERITQHRMSQLTLNLTDSSGKPLKPDTPLLIEQRRHRFLFGCNIFKLKRCRTDADNAAYAERFADLLNFATLPFYWWDYERDEGRPADERTRDVVTWCKAQGITTKGHPLAWNYVEPRWLKKDDPENAMQLQLQRVARCAKTFAGDIDIWDVVNEATHYDREFCRKNAPTLTQAIDDIGIGEYVRRAFVAARQANPKATLLINDYRVDPSYEQKVIHELVDGQGKALYDVIGIQSHMHNNYWGAERTWRVCDTFAKYNVPLHFTETTVVSGPKSDQGWVTTAAGEETQAEKVAEFYTLLFSQPAVEAITWWDFTDQNAWQSAPAGLIREDMSPKPAYDRLYDLIKGKWWTKVDTHTMAAGKVTFSGFHGDYRISASINGEKLNARFSLRKHADKAVKLRLS